jgi:hypothetical protein
MRGHPTHFTLTSGLHWTQYMMCLIPSTVASGNGDALYMLGLTVNSGSTIGDSESAG